MTLHPDEQARELARLADEWLYAQAKSMRFSSDFTPQQVPSLVALLARVRLVEAEWWKLQIESRIHGINFYQHMNFDVADKIELERIASLRQAAGEGTKP